MFVQFSSLWDGKETIRRPQTNLRRSFQLVYVRNIDDGGELLDFITFYYYQNAWPADQNVRGTHLASMQRQLNPSSLMDMSGMTGHRFLD